MARLARAARPDLPVLFMSGYAEEQLRKLAGSLTLREARAYLGETCIKIEVEKAGLTESAA